MEQIGKADPQEGEYEELIERMPRLENAEMLVHEAMSAQRNLTGSGGAVESLESALGSLERIAAVDASVESVLELVREAFFSLEDVGRDLVTYKDGVDFPQEELEGGAGPHCRVAGSYAWLRSTHGRCIGAACRS